LAKDIAANPFYRYISRPSVYGVLLLMHLLIPFVFAYTVWGFYGLIALWVNLVVIFNLGDSINSLGHEKIDEYTSMVNHTFWLFLYLVMGIIKIIIKILVRPDWDFNPNRSMWAGEFYLF
jgi:hypothetical protein